MRIIFRKEDFKKEHLLVFSYFLSVIIAGVVYNTGGTNRVYANMMYIPIAVVASVYGKKQGIIHAAVSALLIGPFMPLNVELGISQTPINWVLRLIVYVTIAFVIGFFPITIGMNMKRTARRIKSCLKPRWPPYIPW
jgi:glucose-6-phosphate-specific signal transduction histidine kinase